MAPNALVIDDDTIVRSYLRAMLESRGWAVAEAATAFAGLTAFHSIRPQLITLDLILPNNEGIDAFHLASQIQAENPETTLLVVSGTLANPDIREFCAARKLEWFAKPVDDFGDFHALFERIDRLRETLSTPASQ